jgi:hypothetical protein
LHKTVFLKLALSSNFNDNSKRPLVTKKDFQLNILSYVTEQTQQQPARVRPGCFNALAVKQEKERDR